MKIHCEYCFTGYVYKRAWPNCPNCGAPAAQSESFRRAKFRAANMTTNVSVYSHPGMSADDFIRQLLNVFSRSMKGT